MQITLITGGDVESARYNIFAQSRWWAEVYGLLGFNRLFHPFLCSGMSFIGKVFFRLVDNFCYLLTALGFSKFVPPVLWSSRTGMFFFFSLGSKVGGLFDIDVMIYF